MREKIVLVRSKLNSLQGAAEIGDKESVKRHVADAIDVCDELYEDAKPMTGEAVRILDAVAACDHYRERARRCRAEGLVDDEKLCLRMAREHVRAAIEPLERREDAIVKDLREGGLGADENRRAANAGLNMSHLVAESGDRLKAWLDFESGYWHARAGRPISGCTKPYNLGYRCGQSVNKKLKS